jgi:hypothetical protein
MTLSYESYLIIEQIKKEENSSTLIYALKVLKKLLFSNDNNIMDIVFYLLKTDTNFKINGSKSPTRVD